MTEYTTDTSMVSTVWSAHGHRFMSDGEPPYESCLTCGAMYQLLADATDPTYGWYLTNGGGDPAQCTGDTSMVHGYPGERVCDCEDGCEHCEHDCPCIRCDS